MQGAFKIYELPADPNADMPLRFFEKLPSSDAVVSKPLNYFLLLFNTLNLQFVKFF